MGNQEVDVTAVMADIDAAQALRDRIKAMQATLKVHEDQIKDVMGEATVGKDATGKTVVTYPERNRTDVIRAEVAKRLDDDEMAKCLKHSTYRVLLYP